VFECAAAEGHPLWVLTVGYPGGKTRQVSLRPIRFRRFVKALENYRHFSEAWKPFSELNQFLFRLDREESKKQERSRDRHSPPATTVADGFIAEAVEDLWEPWMRTRRYGVGRWTLCCSSSSKELSKRCKKSKTRGRKADAG